MSPRRPYEVTGTVAERIEGEDTQTYRRRSGDAEHVLHCWDEPSGQGFLLRQEVRGMQKRMWMLQGVLALLVVLGPVVLGVWLDHRMTKAEQSATRRDDSAVLFRQAHADMPKEP